MLSAEFTHQEKRMLQYLLPRDSIAFTRFFFSNRENRKYVVSGHHKVMADVKRKVLSGEIKRLIVNIPPGYSKTEEWVVNFMAEGLAINPQALFMHLSYADDLALWNSTQCKDIVESPEYQELFPMKIRADVSSKKKWYTEQGGGVYATSSGGQVTGFRAGRLIAEIEEDKRIVDLQKEIQLLEEKIFKAESPAKQRKLTMQLTRKTRRLNRIQNEIIDNDKEFNNLIDETLSTVEEIDQRRTEGLPNFWGALIIDDPIKPDDAFSEPLRNRINNRFMNTFKSRLAVESETPMIVIMQRIHEEDPSGFLLTGGTGEKWHHLILPVEVPEEPISKWYPPNYTHGIPIDYDLPAGPLWKQKHNEKELEELSKADPYTYSSQYLQQPSPKGGKIFKDEFWQYYDYGAVPKDIILKRIYCDTAQETKDRNDYTVFQCWGYVPRKGIFLLDVFRDKVETPELEQAIVAFWNKHKPQHLINPIGAQVVKIEKKSSGAGLIQTLQRDHPIPVEAIERNRDKVSRAMDTVPQIASGNVWIPSNAPWTYDFVDECRKFTPLMTHKHDDQLDPMMDAINDLLIEAINIYEGIL